MKKIVKIAVSAIFLAFAGMGTVVAHAQEGAAHAQEGAMLNLKVTNVTEQGGAVMIAVGDLGDPAGLVTGMVPADGKTVECTLTGLTEGKQNIYIYQDANGNGTLDMSETGIPLEGCYSGTLNIESGANEAEIGLIYFFAGNKRP